MFRAPHHSTAILAETMESETQKPSTELGVPFCDNAVLQREMKVPVWGRSKPGTRVTVEFAGQEKTAIAGNDGKWLVKLDPLEANSEPADMTIRDTLGKDFLLKNILVGDVWLCAGQSNMAAKVRHNWANQDPNDNLLKSNYPAIRHIRAPGIWQMAIPENVGEFTRVGFCFARKVHLEQTVPIGLLNACVGGL